MLAAAVPPAAVLAVPADRAATCGRPAGQVCGWVYDRTGHDALAGVADWLVDAPLRVVLVLLGAWLAVHLLHRASDRLVNGLAVVRQRTRGEGPDHRLGTISGVLRAAANAVIWTVAGVIVLQELGLHLGGLVAGATVVGAAVGFGAQALVRDFLSGFFMLVEDQFVVGDVVDVGMASGTVERVTLRTTQLRDDDGTVWYVPNGRIDRVANRTQGYNVAVLDVPVAHGGDLDAARRAVAAAVARVCAEPDVAPLVLAPPSGPEGVQSFDADRVVLRASVRVAAGAQWRVLRLLRAAVLEDLPAAGVALHPSAAATGADGS